MAESVKRRVAAARLAVAFVAAGSIAGATAWAQAGPPPTAQSSASDIFAKVKLDSSNIKNGSLLYQDFKPQQVLSTDAFFKYKKADTSFKKAVNGDLTTIKGELGSVNGDLNAIKGELPSFIKMNDADARYIKMSDAVVRGDGSVFTASKAFLPNDPVSLLSVPSLVSVDAVPGGGQVKITNISGNDLSHSACKDLPGKPDIGAGTLNPGESVSCATDDHTEPIQMIGGGSEVVTLNFTKIGPQITVQILIGL
jgi:hypothetical protein